MRRFTRDQVEETESASGEVFGKATLPRRMRGDIFSRIDSEQVRRANRGQWTEEEVMAESLRPFGRSRALGGFLREGSSNG